MTILENRIDSLLSSWRRRLENGIQSDDYKCAVSECIYELAELLDESEREEDYLQDILSDLPSKEVEQWLLSQEADSQSQTPHPHESAA